jgi:heme oxygenase
VRELSKLLVRLSVETASFHLEADEPWRELADPEREMTRLDYVHHLVQRYGFDAPVEAALKYTPQLQELFDVQDRFRAGPIAQDLLSLGVTPSEMAKLRQAMVTPFSSASEAMGWLYVHQRCSLMFETTRHEIVRKLPELSFATTYLRSLEGRIGSSWDDLGQVFDTVAQTSMFAERVLVSARDAFRTMIEWHRRTRTESRHLGSA